MSYDTAPENQPIPEITSESVTEAAAESTENFGDLLVQFERSTHILRKQDSNSLKER